MILPAILVLVIFLLGAFTKAARRGMFGKSSKDCVDCGRKWDDGWMLEFHHALAVFEGGSDNPSNAVLLCRECHHARHKALARKRKRCGNSKGARGHESAARQIAYRIRAKGLKRYGH